MEFDRFVYLYKILYSEFNKVTENPKVLSKPNFEEMCKAVLGYLMKTYRCVVLAVIIVEMLVWKFSPLYSQKMMKINKNSQKFARYFTEI